MRTGCPISGPERAGDHEPRVQKAQGDGRLIDGPAARLRQLRCKEGALVTIYRSSRRCMMPGSSTSNAKKGLLERLQDGVVIGDGGMMSEMCRRGYAITGIWTPEVCVQHPSAVRELHREFARAGAGVLQALNFYSNDQKMKERGLDCTVEDINRAACRLAREVAEEGDQLISASLTATPVFESGASDDDVIADYKQQLKPIMEEGVDFIVCEWLFDIREMELAIAAGRSTGLPVVACMTIGTRGDRNGVSPEQCALRMASAGADVVGMNCAVGPRNALATIRRMRIALESAGVSRPLIVQPNGLKTPDDGTEAHHLPGWPLAMEPHVMNRLEARAFAREAYKEGVRYIGGCCYSTVYHIRAMAEELQEESGGVAPLASHSGGWAPELANNDDPELAKRSTKEYWMNVCPTAVEPKPAAEFMAGWADCCGC